MRTIGRLIIATVAGVALLFAAVPAASAAIVPGVGMKGIKLDQRKKVVIRKLGQPRVTIKGTNDFGKFQILKYRKFVVNLENKVVVGMSTTGMGQRTAQGIGVGSTRHQVRKHVAGVVCERIGGASVCHVGDYNPGEAVTEFRIKHKIVRKVFIGRVLD